MKAVRVMHDSLTGTWPPQERKTYAHLLGN